MAGRHPWATADPHLPHCPPPSNGLPKTCFGFHLPEFELWQAADEGAELLIAFGGQPRCIALRVNLWGEEAQQQVQVVDPKGIGHNVKAVGQEGDIPDKATDQVLGVGVGSWCRPEATARAWRAATKQRSPLQ